MLAGQIKSEQQSKTYETFWIHLVSLAIWFIGLINILSAWFSFDDLRLNIIKNIFEYHLMLGSRYLVILTGIIAFFIAPTLYRKKRVAWFISVFLLAISGIAHIIKGADIEEACFCIFMLGILLPLYKYCNVKSDSIRLQYGGRLLIASVLFVIVYTFIGIHVFSDQLGVNIKDFPTWGIALNALIFNVSYLNPHGLAAKFFIDSLLVINSFSIFMGLFLALSPVIARSFPEIHIEKYKEFGKKHATQPIQFFALTNDYLHFSFNQGLISYKVANRISMVVGNPCIKSSSFDEITDEWLNYSIEHDWIPAFYQVQGEFVDVLKNKGFNLIPIGVEAIVNLDNFTLEGKAMQSLRTARNKAKKEGWIIRAYTDSDWKRVKELDQKWLKVRNSKENCFAMGKSSPEYLARTRTVLLLDKENNLLGYISNIELPENNSRSIDLMRRNPDSPGGVMEALFLHEILQAKNDDKSFYDLGFSPLAKIDESITDNKTVISILKLIYDKQKKYYDFQGLHAFKAKFQPDWQPSFLAYTDQIKLPQVLIALIQLNRFNFR